MKKSSPFLFLMLFCHTLFGQVETRFFLDGTAVSNMEFRPILKQDNRLYKLPKTNVDELLKAEKQGEAGIKPFKFGNSHGVSISLEDGKWESADGGRIWTMEFNSENALSLNFVFDKLKLPAGGKLYIFNKKGTVLYGPLTREQNIKGKGVFLTDVIAGDHVTISIFEPKAVMAQTVLSIKAVVQGYKSVYSNLANGIYGASGACNNDIDCFPAWDLESDAVALVLLANGTEWCSGSLVSTTDYSFRPYFLTAFHCVDANEDGSISGTEETNAENWMFKFQFKQNGCSGTTATAGFTYNGASLRAAWGTTDVTLMELDNSPIGNQAVSWAGWDRSGSDPSSGTGIHHPSGDVMMISFDNNTLDETDYGSTSAGTNYWYSQIDDGTFEPGSSGSPLFNQNKRIVGQLRGGSPFCSGTMRFWHGAFNRSWTGGGSNATRLSNWLDSCGVGGTTTNTVRSPYVSGLDMVCSSTTYTVGNLPSGHTVSWSSSNGSVLSINSSTGVASRVGSASGSITVFATINTGCRSFQVRKTIWVGNPDLTKRLNGVVAGTVGVTAGSFNNLDASSNSPGTTFNYNDYTGSGDISITIYSPTTAYTNMSVSGSSTTGARFVRVTATNSCGSYYEDFVFYLASFRMAVYPNPAKDQITLKFENMQEKELLPDFIELVNEKNLNTQVSLPIDDILKDSSRLQGNKYTMDISKLERGTWYLRAIKKGHDPEVVRLVFE